MKKLNLSALKEVLSNLGSIESCTFDCNPDLNLVTFRVKVSRCLTATTFDTLSFYNLKLISVRFVDGFYELLSYYD